MGSPSARRPAVAESPIHLERTGAIAHLVLGPPPRNEIDGRFLDAFLRLTEDTLPGLDAQGLIVHGCGRHFSSGANIEELRGRLAGDAPARGEGLLAETTLAYQALTALPFPVVAAISGCCFGSALELALACHHRIAARNALFALPETTFDLMPGCGGTVRLPKLTGLGKAIELILTGRSLLADEAREIGLVTLVVDRSDLLETAGRLVKKLNPAPSKGAA